MKQEKWDKLNKELDDALESEFGTVQSIFENSRLVLREHILANKEKVANDLQEMREKSNNMKTTNRIDSELELQHFLHKLRSAYIEIPSNVTLEIDSPILKSEFNKLAQTWISGKIEPIKRFKYQGENIKFKKK
jgi:hypothetical protein